MTPGGMTELDFARERAALFSSGVGLARLALNGGKPDEALRHLDHYCDRVDDLSRRFYSEQGYDGESINRFLGAKRVG